jgi:hypothetical protein
MADEVLLHVAATLIAQQYSIVLAEMHEHLLALQDTFHEGFLLRRNEFELSCSMAAPMLPVSTAVGQSLATKLEQLLAHYKATADTEVRHFHDSCFEISQSMKEDAFRARAEFRASERQRQDELAAAQQLARREVSATVALLKTEQAQSATEVTAMQALRKALEMSTSELTRLRAEAETVRATADAELLKMRKVYDEERAAAREALRRERDDASAQIRALLEDNDRQRRQHIAELSEFNSTSNATLQRLRTDLHAALSQIETAQRITDETKRAGTDQQRAWAHERLELSKTIATLEYENERMKLLVEAERSQSVGAASDIRKVLEIRKNVEIEDFKRRLITSLGAAGSPPRGLGASLGTHAALEQDHSTSGSPRGAQIDALALRHASPASTARGSHSPRGPSATSARSPSDTFVRLQHLSSSWKDRLATI